MRRGSVLVYATLVIAGALIGAGAALHLKTPAPADASPPPDPEPRTPAARLARIESNLAELSAAIERLERTHAFSTAGDAALDELAGAKEALARERKRAERLGAELEAARRAIGELKEERDRLAKMLGVSLDRQPEPPPEPEDDIEPPPEP